MKTIFHNTQEEAKLHLEELQKNGYTCTMVYQESMITHYAVIYADKFSLNTTNIICLGIALLGFGIIIGGIFL